MATSLDVVNQCLAIMGEAPLNTLLEEHAFKSSALQILTRNDTNASAEGWWFNTERITLTVNPTDSRIYLPGDTSTVRMIDNEPWLVQRGRVLYDTQNGTDIFPANSSFKAELIRKVPFEDTPVNYNAYVARKTVWDFQQEYDGDQTKTRNLQMEVMGAPASAYSNGSLGLYGVLKAEHIRATRVNFILQSERLSRITNTVNYSRRPR